MLVGLVPALVACGRDGDSATTDGAAATDTTKPPYAVTLPWGDFTLNERTAQKLKSGQKLKFAVVGFGTGSLFYTGVKQGMEEAATSADVEAQLLGPADFNPEEQAATLESVMNSDNDGLVVQCSVADLLTPLIDSAMESGVPVTILGEDCPKSKRIAWVGQSYGPAGNAAAEYFLQVFRESHPEGEGPYEVALVAGATTTQYAIGRFEGFTDVIAQEPDITIQGPFQTGYDPAEAYTVVEDMFKGNPGLDGVYVADEEILVVGEYIDRHNLNGEVIAVGFNLPPGVPELIQKNAIQASIGQFTAEQGRRGVEMLANLLQKGELPECAVCDVGVNVVSTENIDEFIASGAAETGG
jgi:simple sugar transport system substrate-binding protein/ribose transport system substrate-binding protein